jgi:hypothetical protein
MPVIKAFFAISYKGGKGVQNSAFDQASILLKKTFGENLSRFLSDARSL